MARAARVDNLMKLWRFSADQYQRMGETGIFLEDDPVELIDEVIVQMSPIGSRHSAAVNRCTRQFTGEIGARAIVQVRGPVRLSTYSELQPDLVILRNRDDFYAANLPGPGDVLLLIEVAESSLAYDRQIKRALYAREGIPEVWILNLADDRVEVSRELTEGEYRQQTVLGRGESISPLALPQVAISVDAILA